MDATLALQLIIQGILLGGIYGLIALGLSLIFGVMGVINFAHGQMMVMACIFPTGFSFFWGLTLISPW